MAIINGVDTSTVDFNALGAYLKDQQAREQYAALDASTGGQLSAYLQAAGGVPPVPQPSPTELADWGNQEAQLGQTRGDTLAQLEMQRQNMLANAAFEAQAAAAAEALTGKQHDLSSSHLSASHGLSLADIGRARGNTLADLTKKWTRWRDAFAGRFAHGGTLNSGIYTNALNQGLGDKTDEFNRANQGYDSQLAHLNENYNYSTQANDLGWQAQQQQYSTAQQRAALQNQQALAQNAFTGTSTNNQYQTAMNAIASMRTARKQELAAAIQAV